MAPTPDENEVSSRAAADQESAESSATRPDASEVALRALRERPRISIRMQVYFTVIFSFLVILGTGTALLISTRMMETKIHFLEIANDYLYEIQNARRYEKNYFLYNTNLPDAFHCLDEAKRIIQENAGQLRSVVGEKELASIKSQQEEYALRLRELERIPPDPNATDHREKRSNAEAVLRRSGQQAETSARNLLEKEKKSLDRMILLSRYIHFFSLLFLFLTIGLNTYVLGRRILAPIRRFVKYTQRFAKGDYTPIMPARRYRDEFSDLAVAVNHMIRELERRQDILVQSHKLRAVGTLTAGVAHELNNPVNNLMLTAYTLLEDYRDLSDEEKLEMVNEIAGETERFKRIISNLLDFARESESELETTDLGNILRDALRLTANQINLHGVRGDLEIDPNLPPIYGDRQQLCQVFLNLILNALDVTPKGGRIRVMVKPSDTPGFLLVSVTDYGCGIPEHILPHIFDPFFTTKSKRGGTGLGLSVSQGIIARHGGEISVRSKVNVGTTFIVTLPVAAFGIRL